MLTAGGYINILIATAHVVGLFWAEKMFEVTGVGHEMGELSAKHPFLPYGLTLFVAIIFFIFGLYGLSADGRYRKLPFLKLGVFTIAVIYLLRGMGELIFNTFNGTNTFLGTLYSLFALAIGLLYLSGGIKKIKKWNLRQVDRG